MDVTTCYILGGGLVLIQVWWEFEVWGYKVGFPNIRKMNEEIETKIEENKDNSFWYNIQSKVLYVFKKRILAKIGLIIVVVGLLIQIK